MGTVIREPAEGAQQLRSNFQGCPGHYACRRAAPRPLPLPRAGFLAAVGVGGGELPSCSSSLSPARARAFPAARPAARAPAAPPPAPLPGPSGSRSAGFQSRKRRRHAALPISWYSSRVTTHWANSGRRAKATAERYASKIGLAGRTKVWSVSRLVSRPHIHQRVPESILARIEFYLGGARAPGDFSRMGRACAGRAMDRGSDYELGAGEGRLTPPTSTRRRRSRWARASVARTSCTGERRGARPGPVSEDGRRRKGPRRAETAHRRGVPGPRAPHVQSVAEPGKGGVAAH